MCNAIVLAAKGLQRGQRGLWPFLASPSPLNLPEQMPLVTYNPTGPLGPGPWFGPAFAGQKRSDQRVALHSPLCQAQKSLGRHGGQFLSSVGLHHESCDFTVIGKKGGLSAITACKAPT